MIVSQFASVLVLLALAVATGVGVYAFYYSQRDAVVSAYTDLVNGRRIQIHDSFQIGADGPQGGRGQFGPQGPKGPPGLDGVVGSQGIQGGRGLNGTQGVKGRDGLVSPAGPTGDRGANGTDWVGIGPVGVTGDIGLTGPDGAQGPYSSSAYGPTGPDGPQGPLGTQGLTGPDGLQGPVGPTGGPGPRGISPTGDTGPAGPAGNGGPRGFQGFQGPMGSTGPTIVRQDWIFGDGSDGSITIETTATLYRALHAVVLNITASGRLLNPMGYPIYAQREIQVWGSIEVPVNTNTAGYRAGLGGYTGHQSGFAPSGSGCTTRDGFGIGNHSETVTRCVEWDYYLQMPAHFVTSGVAGQAFVAGGGAAGGGDSLWEAYYNLTFCQANDWVFCGGPGGESGGFLYLATPSLLGNGTIAVPGGNGTTVEIGGYGGNGGGGGLVVVHTFQQSSELSFITSKGYGGRSGLTLDVNSTTYLSPGANGTDGHVYLNKALFSL